MTSEPTSTSELGNLRSIAARCLSDIKVPGLSEEQQFITAYDAARTLSLMVVRAAGYRPKKPGGHYNVFAALAIADEKSFGANANYLQNCRNKRNTAEYDYSGGISLTETDELLNFVEEFSIDVERWISTHYPAFSK